MGKKNAAGRLDLGRVISLSTGILAFDSTAGERAREEDDLKILLGEGREWRKLCIIEVRYFRKRG